MAKNIIKIVVSTDIPFYGSSKEALQKILGTEIGAVSDGGETFTILEGSYEIPLCLDDMTTLSAAHELEFSIINGVIYLQ